MNAMERRQAILEALCERRHDTMSNLAFEFNVGLTTIKRDLLEHSLSSPPLPLMALFSQLNRKVFFRIKKLFQTFFDKQKTP